MNDKKLMVINVLPKDYYTDCYIKGSISVPLEELRTFAENLDRETPIVVYCASYSSTASSQAWQLLDSLGFENLWSYEGGMSEWYYFKYPMEGACSKEYLAEFVEEDLHERIAEVVEISAADLRKKMEEAGLFS